MSVMYVTKETLEQMRAELQHMKAVERPAASKAIAEAKLIKDTEHEMNSQEVEPFFEQNTLVKNRILKSFSVQNWSYDPPAFQMSQCFVDFVLRKKTGP